MLRRILYILILVSIALTAPAAAQYPYKKPVVDVALILALDVSSSMNADRWGMQTRGYAEAFRSPEVQRAITSGPIGTIAVTFVQWSLYQQQTTDWYLLNDKASAEKFADVIERMPRSLRLGASTSISGAIDFSVQLFEIAPLSAMKRIIDVSGDGENNAGRPADLARDEAVEKGVIINGLPILADELMVGVYYHDHVIGGVGSFSILVFDIDEFGSALKRKLIMEMASRSKAAE